MLDARRGFDILRNRPRLVGSLLAGTLAWSVLPAPMSLPTRGLVAWDIAVALYLVLAFALMAGSSHEGIRRRAREQDDGAVAVLVLSLAAALASVAGIAVELWRVKSLAQEAALYVALSTLTIVLSWLFVHTSFALHYAHEYFSARSDPTAPPLLFPGSQRITSYADFLYFSFTIGATGQTSDVGIASTSMRKLVLVHGVLSFFFNTTLLAMAVNVAASVV